MTLEDLYYVAKEALEYGVSPEDMPYCDPEIIRAAIEELELDYDI